GREARNGGERRPAMTVLMKRLLILAALVPLAAPVSPLSGQGGPGGGVTRPPTPPRFRFMGPATGGRIAAVAGVPGDSMTIYWGAASGGVWKSTDGGQSHAPVFDNQKVQSSGSLAVSASNPEIVWAGTGEAWAIRDADVMGDGIYKSVDAGITWTNMGLRGPGRIGRR